MKWLIFYVQTFVEIQLYKTSLMSLRNFLGPFGVMQGHLGSWMDILGMKALHWRVILGHKGQFWAIKGAVLGHFGAPVGLWKGSRVVQHDIISCNVPMGSVLGPFGSYMFLLILYKLLLILFWLSTDFYWLSTNFYRLPTDPLLTLYWLSTGLLQICHVSEQLKTAGNIQSFMMYGLDWITDHHFSYNKALLESWKYQCYNVSRSL